MSAIWNFFGCGSKQQPRSRLSYEEDNEITVNTAFRGEDESPVRQCSWFNCSKQEEERGISYFQEEKPGMSWKKKAFIIGGIILALLAVGGALSAIHLTIGFAEAGAVCKTLLTHKLSVWKALAFIGAPTLVATALTAYAIHRFTPKERETYF